MNPPPFNDGLFSKTQGVISSSAWRQWFGSLVSSVGGVSNSIYTIPTTSGNSPVLAVDWNNGPTQVVALGHTGTATITLANGADGRSYMLCLVQPAGGGKVVSMSISGVRWAMQITPTQTLTPNAVDGLIFKNIGITILGEMSPNF